VSASAFQVGNVPSEGVDRVPVLPLEKADLTEKIVCLGAERSVITRGGQRREPARLFPARNLLAGERA